jgi:caffeoyl-CoA O-methyltransferase
VPGVTDLDYIESTARPIEPVIGRIEAAAAPERIPILARDAARVLGALAAGRRRVVEVGTAYGYSTLWLALGQPADGTIVTIDPDAGRTAIARGFWREAGISDTRIVVVNRPALEAFADSEASLAGPFDLAFIDALKPEYEGYLEAVVPRLVPGGLLVADNVLWSGRVSGAQPDRRSDGSTEALRSFNARVLRDPRFNATILPVGDGLLVAGFIGA